jgi:hypothetical protein
MDQHNGTHQYGSNPLRAIATVIVTCGFVLVVVAIVAYVTG